MIRFQCGQCGHRLAVHKRQLGELIVCPECAGSTHPVAETVLKHRAAKKPGTAALARVATHSCANCLQVIGKLQKLQLWDNKVVCAECHRRLTSETTALAHLPAPVAATPVPIVRRNVRATLEDSDATLDPMLQTLTRPFRGGLFGALVGLCVAAAALYGAMSLLKEVAGIVAGLAIGGLALLLIYVALRSTLLARREPEPQRPARRIHVTQK